MTNQNVLLNGIEDDSNSIDLSSSLNTRNNNLKPIETTISMPHVKYENDADNNKYGNKKTSSSNTFTERAKDLVELISGVERNDKVKGKKIINGKNRFAEMVSRDMENDSTFFVDEDDDDDEYNEEEYEDEDDEENQRNSDDNVVTNESNDDEQNREDAIEDLTNRDVKDISNENGDYYEDVMIQNINQNNEIENIFDETSRPNTWDIVSTELLNCENSTNSKFSNFFGFQKSNSQNRFNAFENDFYDKETQKNLFLNPVNRAVNQLLKQENHLQVSIFDNSQRYEQKAILQGRIKTTNLRDDMNSFGISDLEPILTTPEKFLNQSQHETENPTVITQQKLEEDRTKEIPEENTLLNLNEIFRSMTNEYEHENTFGDIGQMLMNPSLIKHEKKSSSSSLKTMEKAVKKRIEEEDKRFKVKVKQFQITHRVKPVLTLDPINTNLASGSIIPFSFNMIELVEGLANLDQKNYQQCRNRIFGIYDSEIDEESEKFDTSAKKFAGIEDQFASSLFARSKKFITDFTNQLRSKKHRRNPQRQNSSSPFQRITDSKKSDEDVELGLVQKENFEMVENSDNKFSSESLFETQKQDIFKYLNNSAKHHFQLQIILIHPSKELDDKTDMDYLDENFHAMCDNIRNNRPTLAQLENRFIVSQNSKKFVDKKFALKLFLDNKENYETNQYQAFQTDFGIKTATAITTAQSFSVDQSELRHIDFFFDDVKNVTSQNRLSQSRILNDDSIWILDASIDSPIKSNIKEPFSVSLFSREAFNIINTKSKQQFIEDPFENKCVCEMRPVLSNNEDNDKTKTSDSRTTETSASMSSAAPRNLFPFIAHNQGSLVDKSKGIKRNTLWSLYVCGIKVEYYRSLLFFKKGTTNENLTILKWKRTLRTSIIIQTLFESGSKMIPKKIFDIVEKLLSTCTIKFFYFENNEDFEFLLEFIEPFLHSGSFSSLGLRFKLRDNSPWPSCKIFPLKTNVDKKEDKDKTEMFENQEQINSDKQIYFEFVLNLKMRVFRKVGYEFQHQYDIEDKQGSGGIYSKNHQSAFNEIRATDKTRKGALTIAKKRTTFKNNDTRQQTTNNNFYNAIEMDSYQHTNVDVNLQPKQTKLIASNKKKSIQKKNNNNNNSVKQNLPNSGVNPVNKHITILERLKRIFISDSDSSDYKNAQI